MGNKGIYTALSGAIAQSQKLDTIANNMANVNTPGFKKDANVFREYLTANEKIPDVIQVPRVPASVESFYDMQAGDRGYVDNVGTYTDQSQGAVKLTGNDLDLAIEGLGFFEVLTPSGVQLTRHGSFKVDGEGRLVNKEGHPILAEGTGNPESRFLQLSGGKVTVSYSGEILDGQGSVGKLSVLNVENPDSLQKVGNSLYTFRENMNPVVTVAQEYKLHQGALEGSNVNIIKEMTDMIAASRVFESTQKTIKAFDEMNSKLVNEVPKTT